MLILTSHHTDFQTRPNSLFSLHDEQKEKFYLNISSTTNVLSLNSCLKNTFYFFYFLAAFNTLPPVGVFD